MSIINQWKPPHTADSQLSFKDYHEQKKAGTNPTFAEEYKLADYGTQTDIGRLSQLRETISSCRT